MDHGEEVATEFFEACCEPSHVFHGAEEALDDVAHFVETRVMGVRPEDLTLVNAAAADPGHWRVLGRIGVVEPLGSETLVSVDIEGHELTGIAKGRAEPAVGSVAQCAFNIENLHLFDHKSGAAIR